MQELIPASFVETADGTIKLFGLAEAKRVPAGDVSVLNSTGELCTAHRNSTSSFIFSLCDGLLHSKIFPSWLFPLSKHCPDTALYTRQ